METDIDWAEAAGDNEFKRKLSDVARDILKNAGSDEETLENLQKVAKNLVSKAAVLGSRAQYFFVQLFRLVLW